MPRVIKRLVVAVLLLWLGWHLAVPINLTVADVGRHIKNGELILNGTRDVLYKNFYSYSWGDYPFINHHWLFGVFCFIFWCLADFSGLSLVYILIQLAAFGFFLHRASRFSSFWIACVFGLLSFPLLTYRLEIRPEGISMLLCGLFWWLLSAYRYGQLKSSHLKIWICLLQIVWVNTHVFFIMGPVLALLSWGQARIEGQKEQAEIFKKTLWLVLVSCLVNPSGLWGALVPLNIFKGFGYTLAENQSVFFMYKRFPQDTTYLYFLIALGIMIVPWIALLKREGVKKHVSMLILMIFLSAYAMKVVRLITPFGFFWIVFSSYGWGQWMQSWPAPLKNKLITLGLVAGLLVSATVRFNWHSRPYLGLMPGANGSAEFFKTAGLQGRVFNNYDIGGYLIFHFVPQQKFFVDNRQEAFPQKFFREVYIPMQQDNAVWQKTDAQYGFNVIFFDRHDLTPWGQEFLIHRISDPLWAPVFVDGYTIIFLKRNSQNANLIRRYELPSSMFAVTHNN